MGKTILTFTALFLATICTAQITMDAENIPGIGEFAVYGNDTLPSGISAGVAGENQVWDFVSLEEDIQFTLNYIDPEGTDFFGDFPDSDLCLDFGQGLNYLQTSPDALVSIGTAIEDAFPGQDLVVQYDDPLQLTAIPVTYGDYFTTTGNYSITLPSPVPDADSIQVNHTETQDVIIDGWGQVITPEGTFDCLRRQTTITTQDIVYAYIFGIPLEILNESSSRVEYQFLTKEAKGSSVNLIVDAAGTITEAQFFKLSESGFAPQAQFTYMDNMEGDIDFMDESNYMPTEWLWDFGDGNTSTDQNPNHIFAENGSYEVCLTVGNAQGSSTTCQTIDVIVTGTEDLVQLELTIGPNPASDVLFLNWNSSYPTDYTVLIFDTAGNLVIRIKNSDQIDLNTLNSGIYFMQVEDEDQNRSTSYPFLKSQH